MKDRHSQPWIPFWVDKWLLGSMRIELTPEERGIWIDLWALAGKDSGFIRANEELPYLMTQLAGWLVIPEDKLKAAIEKFIELGKYTRLDNGILYITKWDKYKLSPRHRRRFEEAESPAGDDVSGKADKLPATADTNIKSNTKSKSKNKSNSKSKTNDDETEKLFLAFWEVYPHKMAKQDARSAFKALLKKEPIETIIEAMNGYNEYLKSKRVEKGISLKEQKEYILYPASFLRKEKWQDYVGFKYKAPL